MRAHADPGHHGQHHHAPERRDADQNRAAGAGKTDMGKRMAGEGLPAQDEEITDQPRDDRDDGRRRESIPHEIVFKHRHVAPLPDRCARR